MARTDLNRVSYVGFDFDSHLDELRARTQVRFAAIFNDFTVGSLGTLLFDHTAFALDTLSFYLDRRVTDMFIGTARTPRAVTLLARQLGYKISPAIASSVDLQVTLNSTYAFDVPIHPGFQFLGPDGLIFEAAEEVIFSPGETVKVVPAYEGETVTETFVSDGGANQVFQLRRVPEDKYIVQGVAVSVDGAAWVENEVLVFEASDQFEIAYIDTPPTLAFGNALAGNIPATNATIVAVYVASRGKAGQVSSGTITAVITPLVIGFQTIPMTVTNPEGSKGGDDPETLEQAKANAPKVWKSRKVAVTQEDYESLAGAYTDPVAGRVAVARALSARSAQQDLTLRSLLQDINNTVQEPEPTVTQAVADSEAALDLIRTALGVITDRLTDIATETTGIDTGLQGAIADGRVVKNKANEVDAGAVHIQGKVTDGKAAVDAIADDPTTSQLTTADKNALKAYFDSIDGSAGDILTASAVIWTGVDNEITVMGQARDRAFAIGLTVAQADSLLDTLETERTLIETEAGEPGPPPTGIYEDLEDIDTAVQDVSSLVEGYTEEIFDHIDRLLSADCKSNLITVPILTRDAGGFYTTPTTALVRSLQAYLEARKETTQSVRVVSGEDYLVPAVVSIRAGILTGYSLDVLKATLTALAEGVLRDRAFAASLYLDEFYNAFKGTAGVRYVNITIEGYLEGSSTLTDKLDAKGNLIVESGEVVTRGSVTAVTVEAS